METPQTQNLESCTEAEPQEATVQGAVQQQQKKKKKNPRRVAAGKKGAEARWRASAPSVQQARYTRRCSTASHCRAKTCMLAWRYINNSCLQKLHSTLYRNSGWYRHLFVFLIDLFMLHRRCILLRCKASCNLLLCNLLCNLLYNLKVQAKQVDPFIMN